MTPHIVRTIALRGPGGHRIDSDATLVSEAVVRGLSYTVDNRPGIIPKLWLCQMPVAIAGFQVARLRVPPVLVAGQMPVATAGFQVARFRVPPFLGSVAGFRP